MRMKIAAMHQFAKTLVCFIAGLCLLTGMHVAHSSISRVRVNFDPNLGIEILHGYPYNQNRIDQHLTVGFLFHNHGSQRQIDVEIIGNINVRRQVSIPPGESRRLFVYLPHIANTSFRVAFTDTATDYRTKPRYIRSKGTFSSSRKHPKYKLARLGVFSVPINVVKPWYDIGRIADSEMPDHWRGLTGITALAAEYPYFMSEHPWKQTVMDWVSMGGILLISASGDSPVDIDAFREQLAFAAKIPRGRRIRVGFGYVAVVSAKALANIDTGFLAALTVNCPCHYSDAISSRQLRKHLLEAGQPPRWILFLLLTGFALLIGPLGWGYLVKKKKRPFSYLAIVVFAAGVFSTGILLVTFLSEGITPKGVRASLHFVDLRSNTHISLKETGMFAPTQYGTTIEAPKGSSLLLPDTANRFRGNRKHSMAVGTSRETLEGAVPVRERRLIGVRNLSRNGGRLIIAKHEHGLRVENHLHGGLKSLSVWREGKYYAFGKIPRGAAATARAIPEEAKARALPPAKWLLLKEGNALLARLQKGELGDRYFTGVFEAANAEQSLFKTFREIKTGEHLLAGVYE